MQRDDGHVQGIGFKTTFGSFVKSLLEIGTLEVKYQAFAANPRTFLEENFDFTPPLSEEDVIAIRNAIPAQRALKRHAEDLAKRHGSTDSKLLRMHWHFTTVADLVTTGVK